MISEHATETDLLAPAAARLMARYGQLIDAETIHRVLHETYRTLLANATVTNFLPILAERSAATQLADTPDRSTRRRPSPYPSPNPAGGPSTTGPGPASTQPSAAPPCAATGYVARAPRSAGTARRSA